MTDRNPDDLLLDEAVLDRLLQAEARTPPPPFPAALRARILAAAPARRALAPAVQWMRAASIAATLSAGAAAGFAGGAAAFSTPGEQVLLNLVLSGPEDPFAAFLEESSMENGA